MANKKNLSNSRRRKQKHNEDPGYQNHVFGMNPTSLPEPPSEEPTTADLYEPIDCGETFIEDITDNVKYEGTNNTSSKCGKVQDLRESENNINQGYLTVGANKNLKNDGKGDVNTQEFVNAKSHDINTTKETCNDSIKYDCENSMTNSRFEITRL